MGHSKLPFKINGIALSTAKKFYKCKCTEASGLRYLDGLRYNYALVADVEFDNVTKELTYYMKSGDWFTVQTPPDTDTLQFTVPTGQVTREDVYATCDHLLTQVDAWADMQRKKGAVC